MSGLGRSHRSDLQGCHCEPADCYFELAALVRFVRSTVGLPHFFCRTCHRFSDKSSVCLLVKNSLLDLLAISLTGGLLGGVVGFLLACVVNICLFIGNSRHMKCGGQKSVGSVSGMPYKSYVINLAREPAMPRSTPDEREMLVE